MSKLIRTAAVGASEEERMAIFSAVHRTSENCLRTIDFRPYFASDCRPFNHLGLNHYLDADSSDLFIRLLKKTNGRYTLGIYDEILDSVKKRYNTSSVDKPRPEQSIPARVVQLNRSNVSHLAKRFPVGSTVEESDKSKLTHSLVTSIEQRVHEEHYLSHCKTIIYLATQNGLNYTLNCAFRNESVDDFWQYIHIGKHDSLVKRLLSSPEIQYKLDNDDELYVNYFLVKKVIVEGKLQFIHLPLNEALERLKHDEKFAQFFQHQDIRLVRLEILNSELNENLYVPSILDSEYSARLNNVNRTPSNETKALINSSNRLVNLVEENNLLTELDIFKVTRSPKQNTVTLPTFLQDLLTEGNKNSKPTVQAVHKNKEKRLEDRFKCVTNCIVTDCETDYTYVGKTIDISTRGIAIKFDQEVLFSDKVKISLPAINKRMGIIVKNQAYSCVHAGESVLRVKITGDVKEHRGRFLKSEFISKYFSQLKINGKQEDLTGLSQLLRSVISSHHTCIPFTYIMDKRASFVETFCINEFSKIRNVLPVEDYAEFKNLFSSKGFNNFVSYLLKQFKNQNEVKGYLLVLPNVSSKSGKEYSYWLEDFKELVGKQGNFEFIEKLNRVSAISILSVRLIKPQGISDRFFADELQHLKRLCEVSANSLATEANDIVAYGELKDVTDIFLPTEVSEVQLEDDSIYVEV